MAPQTEFNWDSDTEEGDRLEVRTEAPGSQDEHDADAEPLQRLSEIRRFRDVIYDYSKFRVSLLDASLYCVCVLYQDYDIRRLIGVSLLLSLGM